MELSRGSSRCCTRCMLNAGRVLTREQLEEQLYGWGEEIETNADRGARAPPAPQDRPGRHRRPLRGVGYMMPRDVALHEAHRCAGACSRSPWAPSRWSGPPPSP